MGTKLAFTTVGFIFGILVAISGLVILFIGGAGGQAVLGQGIGLMTLVIGIYSTANVQQKKVISQNYRPELAKEK